MKYKWLWSLLVVAMITICLFIFLPLNENQSIPSSLPNENNLKKKILDTGEVNVNTIFEQIALDEKHVFIPHLSSDNQYGYSLLEWVDNKWEVTYVTSSGEPLLWNIAEGSQSESYFIWNLETKYNIDYLTFYMIKHRNFRSGWGGEFYEPAIQIENNVSLGDKPYGIYKVSDEWQRIWKATQIKVEEQEEDLFSFNNEEALHYGVKGYDKENNYVDPYNYYENISSFNSGAKTEHVSILDEWDGEQW